MTEMDELHAKMSILGAIDVGIVVLDRDYRINMWNEFMQNHSGLRPSQVRDKNLFKMCPEVDQAWLERKVERVWELDARVFITWEQRPYVFRFRNSRPVSGYSEWMYQNLTVIPLHNTRGEVYQVCLILYDVSEQVRER
ncbi:MAG: PAS domain-containing protein [Pseudomonadota bacterium]